MFYGLRIVATLAMLVPCIMLEPSMPPNPVMKLALMASGVAAGWILPRFVLEKKVAKRQEILRLSLPDALDLLVVSVEAGLGLDQAIQHVGRELQVSHPELSEELSLVTLEMRAGKRRSDALRNFAERTGEPEIRKLVAILIQNDRFGTSMGESLRTHSDFMRVAPAAGGRGARRQGGRETGVPDFLFHFAVDADRGGGPGHSTDFQISVPDDETSRWLKNKEKRTMNGTLIQGLMWLGRRRLVYFLETAAGPADAAIRDIAGRSPQARGRPAKRSRMKGERYGPRNSRSDLAGGGRHARHAVVAPAQASGARGSIREERLAGDLHARQVLPPALYSL